MAIDIVFPQPGDIIPLTFQPEGTYNFNDIVVAKVTSTVASAAQPDAASIALVLYDNGGGVLATGTVTLNPATAPAAGDWVGTTMSVAANAANCKLTATLTISANAISVSVCDQVENITLDNNATEGTDGVGAAEQ